MINQFEMKIPYPKKFGIISFNTTKKVRFSFDNMAMFLFREEFDINSSDDFRKWQKEHSDFDFFAYAVYFAAKSHATHNRKRFSLDMGKFALGLAQADKEDIKKLTDCWKKSQEFGIDSLGGKKKAAKN